MTRVPFIINAPKDIDLFFKLFSAKGLELFLVGGCVRDSILNSTVKDWDLVTNANPDEVERILNAAGIRTLETGKQFGVINAFTDDGEYEFATFRSDGEYSDSRRPDSVTFGTIEDDAKRRDLTINSLYYDILTKEVLDFNGGFDDLKNKLIKTVGVAIDRFNEDKLRVLRTIRFANRFRFTLDSGILSVLNDGITLTGVSPERIRDEFLKTLKTAKNKSNAIKQLEEFGLLAQVFPGLDFRTKNVKRILNSTTITTIAFLLRDNEPDKVAKILNIITYSKDEVKNVKFLLSLFGFKITDLVVVKKKLLSTTLTAVDLKQFAFAVGLDPKLVKNLFEFELTVDGNDVSAEFNVKGKELGDKILELEIINFRKMWGK